MITIFEKNVSAKFKVQMESEEGISTNPARVLIYSGDRLLLEITAKIERKQGANGGFYNCVTLEKR